MWKNLQKYWDAATLSDALGEAEDSAPKLRPLPGAAPTDAADTTVPMTLTQLVRVTRVDLALKLKERIEQGFLSNSIGIGAFADITLLDDDLTAAAVTVVDRQVEILIVTMAPGRGWEIARGDANFGVYYDGEYGYTQLARRSQIEGLVPGDRVGLGSCPADALWFTLPELKGMRIPPRAKRAPKGHHQIAYQGTLRAALLHWRYREVTVGSAENAVVRVTDPSLDGLAFSLHRDPDDPAKGVRLEVISPRVPVFACKGGYGRFEPVPAGEALTLHGVGNRIRFGADQQVELPPPAVVVGRFDGRELPTTPDILAVLGIDAVDLRESAVVKHRYRALVRALHPDRNPGDEGHASRFLEVQACWKAYQELYG